MAVWIHTLRYFYFAPRHTLASMPPVFPWGTAFVLGPVFPFPGCPILLRPHSSVHMQYRNFHLSSIGYDFRPRLRPRLTQGRSALPWKPWIFGQEDSHLFLATHSGILPSWQSTCPPGHASSRQECSPTSVLISCTPRSFGIMFQPRTFSAQDLSTSELLRTL